MIAHPFAKCRYKFVKEKEDTFVGSHSRKNLLLAEAELQGRDSLHWTSLQQQSARAGG